MNASPCSSKQNDVRGSMSGINIAINIPGKVMVECDSSPLPNSDRDLIHGRGVEQNLKVPPHPDEQLFSYSFDPCIPILDMSALTQLEAQELCLGILHTSTPNSHCKAEESCDEQREVSQNIVESNIPDQSVTSRCNSVLSISNLLNNENDGDCGRTVDQQNIPIDFPGKDLNVPSANEHERDVTSDDDINCSINSHIGFLHTLDGQRESSIHQSFHRNAPLKTNEEVTENDHVPTVLCGATRTIAKRHVPGKKEKTERNIRDYCNRKPSTRGLRKLYVCPCCNHPFKRKTNCQRHIETVHLNIRKFKCETCSKSFTTKQNLITHKKTKTHNENEIRFNSEFTQER